MRTPKSYPQPTTKIEFVLETLNEVRQFFEGELVVDMRLMTKVNNAIDMVEKMQLQKNEADKLMVEAMQLMYGRNKVG